MIKEFCDICGREITLDEILSRRFATLDIAVSYRPVDTSKTSREEVFWDKKVCPDCEDKLFKKYTELIESIDLS